MYKAEGRGKNGAKTPKGSGKGNKQNEVCSCWAQTGSCKYGDKCIFSHDAGGSTPKPKKAKGKGKRRSGSAPAEAEDKS